MTPDDPQPPTEPGPTADPPAEQEPSIEDPNRFPLVPEVQSLDEAPDGATPADTTDSSADSLPPGGSRS